MLLYLTKLYKTVHINYPYITHHDDEQYEKWKGNLISRVKKKHFFSICFYFILFLLTNFCMYMCKHENTHKKFKKMFFIYLFFSAFRLYNENCTSVQNGWRKRSSIWMHESCKCELWKFFYLIWFLFLE